MLLLGFVQEDLQGNWEVLGEPIQTVMRRYGAEKPYERLKDFTRGQRVDAAGMRQFTEGLKGEIPEEALSMLLQLSPETYIGEAANLARSVRQNIADLRE